MGIGSSNFQQHRHGRTDAWEDQQLLYVIWKMIPTKQTKTGKVGACVSSSYIYVYICICIFSKFTTEPFNMFQQVKLYFADLRAEGLL